MFAFGLGGFLEAVHETAGLGFFLGGGLVEFAALFQLLEVVADDFAIDDAGGGGGEDVEVQAEIGRASCRERV